MYIDKRIVSKNRYHKKYFIRFELNVFKKFNKLCYKKNPHRGFNINKRYNYRSIIPMKKRIKKINIYYFNRILLLRLVVNFTIDNVRNKILTLWCLSNGSFYYSLTLLSDKLFKFKFNNIHQIINKYYFKNN